MPMTIETIYSLFEYHYARFEQIWDSIEVLSEAQFLQDVSYSYGSLRNHMLHIIEDDSKWLAFLQGEALPALAADKYTSRAEVRRLHQQTRVDALNFIQQLDSDFLRQTFVWHPADEPTQRLHGWQILLHIINHGTDHRAQILRVLHDFDAPTFNQDFMRYLVQSGKTNMTS